MEVLDCLFDCWKKSKGFPVNEQVFDHVWEGYKT